MRTGAFLLLTVLSGCGSDQPTSYRIPKEQAQSPAPASPAPAPLPTGEGPARRLAGGEGPSTGPAIHWKAPAGWEESPASGMRYASFAVPGPGAAPADLSVVVLPGDAGGALANVNRWRGQIGLEPLDARGLEAGSRRVASPAGSLLVVDFAGNTARLHAAILETDGNTWFFKLTGEDAAVAAARAAFLDFLASLHFPDAH